MRVTEHPRTKALIAVLFESGARKSEILSLRIRDVIWDEKYTVLRVKGKTGERTLPIVKALPYLRQWLQVHPDRELDSPLFATVRNGKLTQLSGGAVNCCLKRLCERAKIRTVTPHQLRHTRLTQLAKAGLSEYALKTFAGWCLDSRMSARYSHLSGRAHLDSILKLEGASVEEEEREEKHFFKVDLCPNCSSEVGQDQLFCSRCGLPLDEKLQVDRLNEIEALREEVKELRNLLRRTLAIAIGTSHPLEEKTQ